MELGSIVGEVQLGLFFLSPSAFARAGDAASVFKVLCQAPATTSPRIPVRDDPAVRMLGEADSSRWLT